MLQKKMQNWHLCFCFPELNRRLVQLFNHLRPIKNTVDNEKKNIFVSTLQKRLHFVDLSFEKV